MQGIRPSRGDAAAASSRAHTHRVLLRVHVDRQQLRAFQHRRDGALAPRLLEQRRQPPQQGQAAARRRPRKGAVSRRGPRPVLFYNQLRVVVMDRRRGLSLRAFPPEPLLCARCDPAEAGAHVREDMADASCSLFQTEERPLKKPSGFVGSSQ